MDGCSDSPLAAEHPTAANDGGHDHEPPRLKRRVIRPVPGSRPGGHSDDSRVGREAREWRYPARRKRRRTRRRSSGRRSEGQWRDTSRHVLRRCPIGTRTSGSGSRTRAGLQPGQPQRAVPDVRLLLRRQAPEDRASVQRRFARSDHAGVRGSLISSRQRSAARGVIRHPCGVDTPRHDHHWGIPDGHRAHAPIVREGVAQHDWASGTSDSPLARPDRPRAGGRLPAIVGARRTCGAPHSRARHRRTPCPTS